jgi:hypothetical protein
MNRQCSICHTPTDDLKLRYVPPLYICPNCKESKTMQVQAILASSYNPADLQKVVNIVAELESKLNQI